MESYKPNKIENKWQKYWAEKKLFSAKDFDRKPKFYPLIEFPYPSGEGLHVGHPRSYTALDILARKRRIEGYNVLYPIGFDAFGLPTENYAIKTGIHPQKATEKNIKNFKRQLMALGISFDWDREVATTDPEYYKWTQWIFLKMFEKGLAYKAKIPVNWCLSCKIGLANEEVVDGRCERCGGAVEKREKEQWMLKITKYAERLIKDLEKVDYLEKIKTQQINWVGKSEGAEIKFQITNSKPQTNSKSQIPNSKLGEIEVFTTRPDTLFGATYIVLAPEHKIILNLKSQISNLKEVERYIETSKKKSDLERTELAKDKTGAELKGVKAINPVNNKEIPVWISDYVLLSYGTGAIMAVPAHDQRDFEFAKKFGLPIIQVIKETTDNRQQTTNNRQQTADLKEAYEDVEEGVMINSGGFNGLMPKEAIKKITAWLERKKVGKAAVNYKLRDWVFSRQRYWGEPMPIIYCRKCWKNQKSTFVPSSGRRKIKNQNEGINYIKIGDLEYAIIPVPEKNLPVLLPKVKKYKPTDTGESPLAAITKWVNTKCPKCGGKARRETDTMPNWAGSNWYFLRYTDPKNSKALADRKKLEYWIPVDWYNGGMEHTTLHLLYSRFVYKFLYDIGVVPRKCGAEPYKKRTSHGLVLGEDGQKMSKSRGNVINPDEIVKEYGADAFRMYEMFMGPFSDPIPWSTEGLRGIKRFLDRFWRFTLSDEKKESGKIKPLLHKTVKKVGSDIENVRYNTAVSAMMILLNNLEKEGASKKTKETFLTLISPFAPHISEELWGRLGHKESVFKEKWPEADDSMIKKEKIILVIQVNGRLRDRLEVRPDISEEKARKLALKSEKIKKHLRGVPKKIIFVPGRLVNIVI